MCIRDRLRYVLSDPVGHRPEAEMAIRISRSLGVPLHPRYTYLWHLLEPGDVLELRRWASSSILLDRDGAVEFRGPLGGRIKALLERICIPHRLEGGTVIVEGGDALALAASLGLLWDRSADPKEVLGARDGLEAVMVLSGLKMRNKAPVSLGARMGRPEKARGREMKPPVHVLFPVGLAGGPRRDIIEASGKGEVVVELSNRRCPNCGLETWRPICPSCSSKTEPIYTCPRCGRRLDKDVSCPSCKVKAVPFRKVALDLPSLLGEAFSSLGLRPSSLKSIKGVRGLLNEEKIPEPLEKGVLRALYGLSVFRDGTVRFDATNAPLTHFRPREIGTPVEVLRELGYEVDVGGEPLTDPEQVCELKPQDVVLPKEAGEYLVRVAKFLDELLVRFYGLEPYYRVEKPEDLVGHLIVGLAPHTSVGVVGRIIGFTNTKVCYAHPVWHSAKRRDCDGDEDSISLVLDILLNFSKAYLPARPGGMMDAPIFIMPIVRAGDVQRQAQELDVAWSYPLEFYEKTWEGIGAREVEDLVKTLRDLLAEGGGCSGLGYTIGTSDIGSGVVESAYKKLRTMREKLAGQMGLADMLEAVDAREVASRVLSTHFLRDIVGNLRAFSTQALRCSRCGKRFRRAPLSGRCDACGGNLVLTVHRGMVEKYLAVAERLVERYGIGGYLAQRLEMIKDEIASSMGGGLKQASLSDFL